MKICHVSSCFPPSFGGVETYVYNLCKRLVKRGFDVEVITSSRGLPPGKYHEWIDGIEVVRYPERLFLLEAPVLFRGLVRVLADDYDILHLHGMTPTFTDLALLIGKLCKRKPVLLTYHFDPETLVHGVLGRLASALYAVVARKVIKFADRIVATSKPYVETSQVLSDVWRDVIIMPCGVESNRFASNEQDNENGQTGNLHGKKLILYVGKLSWYKGVEHLLKAMGIIVKNLENVHLIIVGEGPQKERLSSLANELELKDHVTFIGGVSNEALYRFYQMTDMLILPSISRREAYGIVLLEAMASGKAVIASNIPGPNSVVKNGETGVLIPPADAEALANAIIDLLSDNDKREKIGACARELVKKRNDWDALVLQYEAIYNDLSKQ